MLTAAVALHDIENSEAFVRATLRRSRIEFTPGEFEDLVCEGLAILFEMGGAWAGGHKHSRKGRFSGYAAMYLPRRLGDAWHRSHPNHRYVTCRETGRRRWHYDPPSLSLDAIAGGPDAGGQGSDSTGDHQLVKARAMRDFVPALQTQATLANIAATQTT